MSGQPAATLADLADGIRRRTLTAREAVGWSLARIEETEPTVHAFAEVFAEEALATAASIDQSIAGGAFPGLLAGVPIGVKEVFDLSARATFAGSKAKVVAQAPTDAAVVAQLMAAGAIVVGRTVSHEFGFGTNVPPTRNAWDPSLAPGGSSAGSAVAVAVGDVPAALGTDSGGSVRAPSALNGVVGFKPTWGALDASGALPMSPSFDTVGCMTRTVADMKLLWRVLSGSDRVADPLPAEPIRVGWIEYPARPEPEIEEALRKALLRLRDSGVVVESTALPHPGIFRAAGTAIVLHDSARGLEPLMRAHSTDIGPGTLATLAAGLSLSSETRRAAARLRDVAAGDMRRLLGPDGFHVIALPGFPFVPGPPDDLAGGVPPELIAAVHDQQLLANVTGLPAITVPCGLHPRGLPIGLQLIARKGNERLLLDLAERAELAGIRDRVPNL